MFSYTLQFITVLVAAAVLDIIQLGVYFDGNFGRSLSKWIVSLLCVPYGLWFKSWSFNWPTTILVHETQQSHTQATDNFLQFFKAMLTCLFAYLLPVHRRFQTRAHPGIAWVKFWSIVLIASCGIQLWHSGSAACVACPGNLAALKPPLYLSAFNVHNIELSS